ncbi:nucleotidyltransferase [Desulfobacteraceae bacterium SEEP-SAG9]|nr:nucleotidyltransferase [Desulfobacteraceae bacterium SEEP-SAG9]
MDQKSVPYIVTKYLNFLKENNINFLKAYIFGSYAKGTYDEDSDIDLAIIIKNLKNSYDMQVHLMKLGRKFDTRIEPHPFDEEDFINSSIPIVYEILQSGIEII